ncbi:MAG: hypothetical protein INR66_00110 [Gordonia polyisoprenivorans]|nr:hypothetical protein [Gordonia polyisoprenivorans]
MSTAGTTSTGRHRSSDPATLDITDSDISDADPGGDNRPGNPARDRDRDALLATEEFSDVGVAELSRRERRARDRARRRRAGVPLARTLTDEARHRLAVKVAAGGLSGVLAQARLRRDDNMRDLNASRLAAAAEQTTDVRPPKLTDLGYTGAGGGRASVIGRMVEVRGTSTQVAGVFNPFSTGAYAPLKGIPVGTHLETSQPVGFDLMSMFVDKKITAPFGFVLALNGFGKSSFVRRQIVGAHFKGMKTLVLGDRKPDYPQVIDAIGGVTATLGYGKDTMNPLAVGDYGLIAQYARTAEERLSIDTEVRGRQVNAVSSLVHLNRGSTVADYEETLLRVGLDILYSDHPEWGGYSAENLPILQNLRDVLEHATDNDDTLARLFRAAVVENRTDYLSLAGPLIRSLTALVEGPMGTVFNGQTTQPLDLEAAGFCIDVSQIPAHDNKLKAAVLMVCWADGFGAVNARHKLTEMRPELFPQINFQIIMDELWQVLGAGAGMVDRVNELTRLHREDGAEVWLITHTINDLSAFDSPADANKAIGFIDRARVKVIGAVGSDELDRLASKIGFTATERREIVSWSDVPPPSESNEVVWLPREGDRLACRTTHDDGSVTVDHDTTITDLSERERNIPYGMGKFLIKFGEGTRPGVPIQMRFTATEWASGIHNTNSRYAAMMDRAAAA